MFAPVVAAKTLALSIILMCLWCLLPQVASEPCAEGWELDVDDAFEPTLQPLRARHQLQLEESYEFTRFSQVTRSDDQILNDAYNIVYVFQSCERVLNPQLVERYGRHPRLRGSRRPVLLRATDEGLAPHEVTIVYMYIGESSRSLHRRYQGRATDSLMEVVNVDGQKALSVLVFTDDVNVGRLDERMLREGAANLHRIASDDHKVVVVKNKRANRYREFRFGAEDHGDMLATIQGQIADEVGARTAGKRNALNDRADARRDDRIRSPVNLG